MAEPGLSTTTPHVRFAGAGGPRQTALILHSLSSKLGYPFGHIAASAVLSDELGDVVAPLTLASIHREFKRTHVTLSKGRFVVIKGNVGCLRRKCIANAPTNTCGLLRR